MNTAITSTPTSATTMTSTTSKLTRYWPYALVMVLALPLLFWQLEIFPAPWFDEGFTTHLVRTWTDRGVYGTYMATKGYIPFDSGVTSGPAVVLPTALSFQLFGVGVMQSRLFVGVLALITLLVFMRLFAGWFGKDTGLLVALALLAMPTMGGINFVLLGRQLLGEPVALGFLLMGFAVLFRAWEKPRLGLAMAAGGLFGIALLAKTQIAITFLPSLGLICLVRFIRQPHKWMLWGLPIAITLAINIIWRTIEAAGQAGFDEAQAYNAEMYRLAIRYLLLPFTFGSTITLPGLFMAAVMVSVGVLTLWRFKAWRWLNRQVAVTEPQFAQTTFAVMAIVSAFWFVLVSIAWPRYGYVGFIFGYSLAVALGWRAIKQWVSSAWVNPMRVLAVIGLVAMAIGGTAQRFNRANPKPYAQLTAAYVRQNIPPNAIVESWEWELGALSEHWEMHHPNELYDFEAIRQIYYERRQKLNLQYDVLQANPDYLIAGSTSDYTQVYSFDDVERNFRQIAEFGPYRIYQRVRR